MSPSRIGRLLVASLHQAIADLLPTRLEFYEHWLSHAGLREGTIGLAPWTAVLGFLRRETAYDLITGRAGQYAADWSVAALPAATRAMIRALPPVLRTRAVLWRAAVLVRSTYGGSRLLVRLRRGTAIVRLRGSLFCDVRETTPVPLCGFYASAIARLCHRFDLDASAGVDDCRAAGGPGCVLSVVVRGAREVDTPPIAA